MRYIFLLVTSILVLGVSCKKTAENTLEVDTQKTKDNIITEKDVSKIKYIEYALDTKTEKAIQDWAEYKQLQDVIINIKKADLSFFNDNKTETALLIKEFKNNIPTTVNASSITARILVLETKYRELESLSNLASTSKKELLNAIKSFFVSFSNLNLQMNKKIEFDTRSIQKP
ncbi:hypothetical protein [uncultured Algibacter sp.]|uniref:hypothetical protein n=1 Tax=uncultured Algibacter sp. TaxID=298659 RepID=UPI003217CF37